MRKINHLSIWFDWRINEMGVKTAILLMDHASSCAFSEIKFFFEIRDEGVYHCTKIAVFRWIDMHMVYAFICVTVGTCGDDFGNLIS